MKLRQICTMEYYSDLRDTAISKNTAKPVDTVVSKISHIQKEKYYMIFVTRVIYKKLHT
jgi:hypothetical protein